MGNSTYKEFLELQNTDSKLLPFMITAIINLTQLSLFAPQIIESMEDTRPVPGLKMNLTVMNKIKKQVHSFLLSKILKYSFFK